jgi:RHH-type transcriptional regulator, proline utilization regulon repressor / proline dehydrogenase / delta 1-pyrroline-5-carboxylate dehydrogenase
MMGYTMRSPELKTQLFRLVDVLPSLRTDEQAARHIAEYLGGASLPYAVRLASRLAGRFPKLSSMAMRAAVRMMSKNFIAGETVVDAEEAFHRLRVKGIGVSFDILGEAVVSEAEAQVFYDRYCRLLRFLSDDHFFRQSDIEMTIGFGDLYRRYNSFKVPDHNCSIKLSALYSMLDPIDPEGSKRGVWPRLTNLARTAMKTGAFLNVDMEDHRLKGLTLKIFKDLVSSPEFSRYPHFGIVVQAYLRDSEKDLSSLISLAQTRGCPFQVRLVKGAYWDYEVANAAQHGCQPPVFMSKAETDANYERLAGRLLSSSPAITAAFGTHNIRSISYVMAAMRGLGIEKGDVEFQGLYGMADEVKEILAADGYRVRSYMPVGDVIPGMAYLVRRLLENTSNESFLRQGFIEKKNASHLLANPRGKQ